MGEDRRDYTGFVQVLDERVNNLKEFNRQEHDEIKKKIDSMNGVKVTVAKLCSSTKWLTWGLRVILAGLVVLAFQLLRIKI